MVKNRSAGAGFAVSACLAWAILGVATASAQNTDYLFKDYETIVAPELEWREHPSIPPGAKMVLVYGDPKQKGPYIIRVKFPAGYKLPAHKHEDARVVTVLQGNYWSGVGEKFEQSKMAKFTPGSLYTTDAGIPHFAWAETDVVIQEMGAGPISDPIQYVDAADDPRKK
jgi:quercetin dioxygenase-like cupin family protein